MEKTIKKNHVLNIKNNINNYGIFLRMNISKEQNENINNYEKIMKSFIRFCKDKYNMQEYAACLERSEGQYMHIHMYVNQFLPLKEINKKWCDLAGIFDKELKGNIYMVQVKDDLHKVNILKYIWKEPLRTWICQSYKDKYGWISGSIPENLTVNNEKSIIVQEEKEEFINKNTEKNLDILAVNSKEDVKKVRKARDLFNRKFICAAHKRERIKLYKRQEVLEKDLIILNSYEDFIKKGGRNFKNNMKILKYIANKIEPFVIYDNICKYMEIKTKQIMLLNMSYIALQLENIKDNHYIYFKIGEKLFKYYDIYKNFSKKLIEDNKSFIKNIKKITKKEWNLMYKNFYASDSYKEYKENIIKIGVRYFNIFKNLFYDVNINTKRLIMKNEIKNKINSIIDLQKVNLFKYKLPLIEKPIEWGPELENYGGWHSFELRESLIKKNLNTGNNLDINHKEIYPVINKLQNIEYEVNVELLNFILENKEKIFEVLLKDFELNSVEYNTLKEQYEITLNIAYYMTKYKKFYFTYKFDYRGRLYVEQEYFNYQGNLLARSLIRWANAKERNLYWFKIACVSYYSGLSKYTESETQYEIALRFYKENIDKWELKDWFKYIKEAKEPILWLSIFHDLKINKPSYEKPDLTKYIMWFDATCSGSQLLSLFLNDDTYLKSLNLTQDYKINDYYTYVYNQYGKFKNVNDKDARKIVKKIVMTINYGLTILGCHRYIYQILKSLKYCDSIKNYKEKWKSEVIKFYNFIKNISLVKKLETLQEIWNKYCKKQLIYEFVIGENGFILNNTNNILIQQKINYEYIFKMKTIIYKKYYKNLSLYNKSRKKKEKGYRFLWHYNKIDKRDQARKIKANLIHMLDATWNILTCKHVNFDIASIHDCHGLHSADIDNYNVIVRSVLIKLFYVQNQYYNLLYNMLLAYKDMTNDSAFFDRMIIEIKQHYTYVIMDIWKWYRIRHSKYIFIPK